MTPPARLWLTLLVLALWPSVVRPGAATRPFTIDPGQSHATIDVGKGGLFSFAAGHTHEVRGPIQSGVVDLDADDPARSQVRLAIDASALKVTAKGEPPDDVPKVQEAMASDKVLDVARYPRITFQSTSVTLKGRQGAALDVIVAGRLTIRDVTRPVTAPVHADLGRDTITATGRFSVKQTNYGIKPISVAGVVTVKDELNISFTIVARP
jgi:polyisoprenoid-binding protein YceI